MRVADQDPERSPARADGVLPGGTPWPWAVAAALIIGNLFLHKPISDVCDALYARIGRGAYERWTLLAIAALSVGGALLLLRRHAAALRRPRVLACVVALGAITVAAQRWLLVTNIELIHFPQFGLLAALLLFAGLGPRAAWIGATLGGVLDETYQYLVVYAHLPTTYFDYNDVVLNAIGAAWAAILGRPRGPTPSHRPPGWSRVAIAVAVAALAASMWIDPPRLEAAATFPYWQPALRHAATGFDYHVMPASEGVAALLLIWGLVTVATRGERLPVPTSVPGVAAALVALVWCGCAGSAPAVHAPAPPDTAAARSHADPWPFIVTFWCGPPLPWFDDTRAAEIAAAGFNVVGAPCEGLITSELNRRALDTAARHGLAMWLNEPRVNPHHGLAPDWESRLDEAVAEFRDHPAMGGFFLIDEPSADQFPDLGQMVARLQSAGAHHLAYINVLPDFAPPELLGTATYREHLEQYMATVRPPLLSYDYYPFKTDADRESFFDNLTLVRDTAHAHRIPFMLIVQAMPHGPYRDPTEAEIAWQVNHALAFGARGISYFAYWTPVHVRGAEFWRFRNGLIENGLPTEHYAQAARLNATARAIAGQLGDWYSLGVADSQRRFGLALPFGTLAGVDGGPVTAGLFSDGLGGFAVLLVNQDYRTATAARLTLRPGSPLPEAFDPATGHWQQTTDLAVWLPPGSSTLLRWHAPTPA